MTGPVAAMLPDGKRLHLQHGPIDLIAAAWGEAGEVQAAYRQAVACFGEVLPSLVKELSVLRARLPSPPRSGGEAKGATPTNPLRPRSGGEGDCRVRGPVARRMVAACWPYRDVFITPMAAVAGAVADHVLAKMREGRMLARAFVNDGGDIAFHLAPGERLTCGLVADLAAPGIDGTFTLTSDLPVRGIATSGRATKGSGGRSFSLGIADAVTVLARDAAAADAAATIVANAVDLPGHVAVRRAPASSIDPDSDLGDIPVTIDVGPLRDGEIACALVAGARKAEDLRRAGHIHGAVLVLRGRFASVGAGLARMAA